MRYLALLLILPCILQAQEVKTKDIISSGDTLLVTINGEPQISGQFLVSGEGDIAHALSGKIDADQKSSNYTIVQSRVLESSDQPELKIDWRVYTKNPSKPLIRDLIVEGLSLARTQKEEFSSILSTNDNDIEALLSKLNDFVIK